MDELRNIRQEQKREAFMGEQATLEGLTRKEEIVRTPENDNSFQTTHLIPVA